MSSDLTPVPPRQLEEGSPEFFNEPPHFSHPRIPEDIRVPWGWLDLVLFVGQSVIASVIIGILVLVVLLLCGVKISAIEQPGRWQGVFAVVAQVIIDIEWIAFLALWIRLRYEEPFWETIGWRKLDPGIVPRWVAYGGLVLTGVVISFLVDAASNLSPPKGNLPIDAIFQDKLSGLLFLLMAVLLAPLVEETIFRGFLYPAIAKSWGVGVSILITGALFGVLHGFQLSFSWWQTTLLVIAGIVFTWVRAGTKTVAASYCLHLGYNSFLFAGFLVSTHFLKVMPPH